MSGFSQKFPGPFLGVRLSANSLILMEIRGWVGFGACLVLSGFVRFLLVFPPGPIVGPKAVLRP
jgi:hypothetical protein